MLVDDDGRCVISDFGQSEMKSEVYRISGTPVPREFEIYDDPSLAHCARMLGFRWDLAMASPGVDGRPERDDSANRRLRFCYVLYGGFDEGKSAVAISGR